MILFLKILFKDFYHLVSTPASRTFLLNVLKYSSIPRYKRAKIRFWNYTLEVSDTLSFIWQFKEIFVDRSYQFITQSQFPVIFDCGSNVGLSCIYFQKEYPGSRIVAFEADPVIAQILEENLKNNNIHNVQIVKKAVWNTDGEIYFASEGADGGSVFTEGEKISIPSVRLKTLLEAEPVIDFLKMDIEGAETDVLNDCSESLQNVRNIFIEYHAFVNKEQELDKILNILTKSGFRYFLRAEQDRKSPLSNHFYKNNLIMDMQTNIFAYRA